MRVLMIQTPSVEDLSQERVYPIGIVLLAGRLQGYGHEVSILDMNLERDPYGALKEKLKTFQPEGIGLSLRNIDPLGNKTSSLISPFIVTVRLIAAVLPQAWLIVGGTGFSLFPERLMLEVPELDYGIVGEAEVTFPALLRSIENPPPLAGLCRREGSRVRVSPPATNFDMANYVPANRLLLDPELYKGINNYVPTIGIEAKRGCALNCAYCVYPQLQGRRLRCRPTAAVVDEMELLHKDYGIQSFHFTDPVLNVPRGHLEGICEEILHRKLKIRWDGFMREDQLNEKNVALFERAGCECFSFSPDGLCQESLDVLGKNLSEAQILKAASFVAQTDVVSVYHFMVNVPGETEKTCEKSIQFVEQLYELHSKKRNLGTIILNNIRILPGTAIERMARSQGVIDAETDLLYPTYYNPKPFNTFRYKLETLQQCRNIFMWQEVRREIK
ncbi:B12 lower ligand biosynthesis radical SAM protein BzaD [Desulfosporosinus sp. BICA1-9]|uniref:B12 lower ligand biosynthesis radical SAM protein BzaD n=1 Tax=Desulfosporosinus sp. BICA1-9 TaxID=1531958 RepID=UPI00054B5980|nr:B12 lower ligand biosynthesis radical SAM protein BzaD [Desulfosporosinus sp. BICA1-9]KJS90158.1 MAG: radical SAM protein [Desulfosporosinus sp. BICA1-9]HBW38928.1 B12 lower ligand biosynthesis radical SAM protein BzaD [Desulfosporosinus sp.]